MKEHPVSQFLLTIGTIEKSLEETCTELETLSLFSKVDTNTVFRIWEENYVSFSMGLSAELNRPINNDLHSWGLSFSIDSTKDKWKFSGEIGWSSFNIGFDEQYSMEFDSDQYEGFIVQVEEYFFQLLTKYSNLARAY
ncbi:MAG: hypothetical protein AAFN93_21530 [Bacteroidota bacterium]